ncbi:hypothetical protein FGB62_25g157 [Gracilaria domingensis]|nr:hypothetical protein FGB62_25g157 [Gracilaria domingensis]
MQRQSLRVGDELAQRVKQLIIDMHVQQLQPKVHALARAEDRVRRVQLAGGEQASNMLRDGEMSTCSRRRRETKQQSARGGAVACGEEELRVRPGGQDVLARHGRGARVSGLHAGALGGERADAVARTQTDAASSRRRARRCAHSRQSCALREMHVRRAEMRASLAHAPTLTGGTRSLDRHACCALDTSAGTAPSSVI